MKIFLHEIKDQETSLDFTQDETWVSHAVARTDEHAADEMPVKPRRIDVHFSLRNVDDVYVVTGKIDTEVHLLCSRCAQFFPFIINTKFSTLFCKDPEMAGIAYLKKNDNKSSPGRPAGQNRGVARHAHDESYEKTTSETGGDLDITYIDSDFIDLADVLTEQIQLLVPFQPLCKEDCKGMCPQCGADQNIGRCACAKSTSSHPFSVLQKLKL